MRNPIPVFSLLLLTSPAYPFIIQNLECSRRKSLQIGDKKRRKDDAMLDDDIPPNSKVALKKPKEGSIGETAYMMESFKKAQAVSRRTSNLADELSRTKIEGTSSDGKCTVTFDGQQRPLGVVIDESFLELCVRGEDGDAEELSKSITEAMQEAHAKSKQVMKEKMTVLYSELGLPTTSEV
eukprot:CAMPEP_0116017404 /NCGR_PEP_ID=MMETSP0321-20121206/8028_1 /TAXON_ID=163516 /ORGANISM="Leptocylindrus danicus var. danicus, Strain B650" /LENGTH=180 /DNA_ID=CAMNT_0003487591 /DNA_START=21 /DNA_END=563 /DNA_ORIENTATION=-